MSELGLVVGSRAPDPTKNNVLKTVLLVVGEMAGGGIVTLPDAVYQAGPVLGLLTIILAGILACYTGTVLAKCFQIATRTFPDPDVALLTEIDSPGPGRQPLLSTDPALEPVSPSHDKHADAPGSAVEEQHYQKHPYIYIGGCALGKVGEYAVLVMQLLALTGVGIVFIIISAENLNSIWPDKSVSFWMWMVIIVVIPLSWLESPKDFWQAAVIAALASFVVVVGATILSIEQAPSPFPGSSHVTFDSYFLAFGTIMFAYGGHALFPTLQVDMQHPHLFRRAMAISFAIILCMYVAVCSAAYYSFGSDLDKAGNILLNLHGKTADGLTGVLTIHLLFAIIIIQNPVSQLFDRWLHTPPGFNLWRVILRTNYIAICAVIAFNVPAGDFICIVNLIGGITTPALGFVFPSLFYLILKHKGGYTLHWAEWALHATVVSVGVFCGVSSTRSAIISDSCAFLR